jgi:thiamine phosphate synthase YjbQ (UPF0047 family)
MDQATHILRVRTERRGLLEITDSVRSWCESQQFETGLLTLFWRGSDDLDDLDDSDARL